MAKKYKKKTKFKNHIESQVTYELEDDFDNTKTGDLGQGFSHGDTIAVVAENLNSDNRRKSEQETVLYSTSLTLDQVLRLEGSVAQAFSGNGKGLSKVRNNKLISGNGSGTNFPPEHAQMNESEKALSCGEKKKKLISGNGSGANFPQEHALLKGPGLPEMEERRAVKDPKPMAWDESKKSSDQIVSEKEVKHHEKHTTLLDDIPDNEEIPIVADEQDDVEEIITKTKQSSDSKETERKFVEKERKERNSRQSNKKPNTHLSAADVEELEKLKNREKNSTKMLKKLKSVLNLVITEEDIIEDEDTKRVGDNVDGSKPHLVTKVDLKKSQMEIDSFLDTLYLDEKEDSQEDIKANDSTSKLDTENEDTEESLCSWDSDTELEKEISDLFLKEEKINQTSRERKSPDGAEMEIPIDNSLCKAYIMWLIWCKERCTCGAFLENPFGKNSGAIEKELIRNAEEYVKDNFPYLKDKMSLKSFENKNSKRDPSEKTKSHKKSRQNLGTDEIDVSGRIIEAVHYAQRKTSLGNRHKINGVKEPLEQRKNVEDVDKVSNENITESKWTDKKTKRQYKGSKKYTTVKDFDKNQKSMRKVDVSEDSDGRYGSADIRGLKQTAEHKNLFCKNQGNAEYYLAEENYTTTESSSNDTQNNVVAFEGVQPETDDENDVFQPGRSNPVGKKNHVDYVIDSDDEDNFIVLRSSTAEYPAKVKCQGGGNTNKMSGRNMPEVMDKKIEKANVSLPKTLVSFERSGSFSKCILDDMDSKQKANVSDKMETKTVSVPFESELEVEARRKPRGIRQLSSECENIAEDREENEYNVGKRKVGKGTRKRPLQFKGLGNDKEKAMQRGQDDADIFDREQCDEALDNSGDVLVSGIYAQFWTYCLKWKFVSINIRNI